MSWLLIIYSVFNLWHASETALNGLRRRARTGNPPLSSIIIVFPFNLLFGFWVGLYLFCSAFKRGFQEARRK